MPQLSAPKSPARLAFIYFLRTGLRLPEDMFVAPAPLEAKFNPNHDPTNGQFTFGSGGGGRRSRVDADAAGASPYGTIPSLASDQSIQPRTLSDGLYLPENALSLTLAGAGSEPPRGIGGNYGAFLDPMTLEQTFPGLAMMPGGSVIAVGANMLGLTTPASEMTTQMSMDYSRALIADIRSIDPSYRFDSLGFPETFEGQMRQINDLRWDRAAEIYRATGDTRPLQVETLRFLQDRTDAEYDNALAAARVGRLPSAPTERMAIGNYIDRAVKADFRDTLSVRNLSVNTGSTVRVSGREYETSGTDLTYSVPDARVGDTAFDITLWQKGPTTRQVRQFFGSDFKPSAVVIIRPRQLGNGSTYLIKRPGK